MKKNLVTKLLGIVVLGLLWFNVGFASDAGGIREPGTDEKCFYVFERENIFKKKFLPKAKARALGGVLVTYVGCNKYYDDWSWDYSTFPDIDVAHQKAYDGCTKTEIPKYNLTGCHLFSIDDVIVWGKDAAFVAKVEKESKQRIKKTVVGCIEGNCINGQGTETYTDGFKYVGEFKNGERNGQGIGTWPDGNTYTGEWINDKRNGHGTGTWPDGYKYVGVWKDDKQFSEKPKKKYSLDKTVGSFVYSNALETDYIFSKSDPTTFKQLTFKKERSVRVEDCIWSSGKCNMKKRNMRAFSFIAEYEENIKVKIFIEYNNKDKKISKENQKLIAEKKALYFSRMFGQMPYFLKIYTKKIYVYRNDGKIRPWWVPYKLFGQAWRHAPEFHLAEARCGSYYYKEGGGHYDECAETMIHELAHVVNYKTKLINPSKWLKARKLDKNYCSSYAKTNSVEDFAESVVCWIGVRYKSHKMNSRFGNVKKINRFIPNRLKFFDELNLKVHPIK